MNRTFILFLCVCIACVACTHAPQLSPAVTGFIAYPNILYGTDDTEQNMDVDLPLQRDMQHTPVVILIHGGAWVTGNKSDFYGLGLDTFFTNNGCAVVNINYRLYASYSNVAPLEMDDIGLVISYIQQHASAWQINPNRICFLGKSSGSQLALLYAYRYNADGHIKAVIDGFGPTNFTDTSVLNEQIELNVALLLGASDSVAPQLWHNNSPIYYMANAVPTVIYQGTLDQVVNPLQSAMLLDSLQARNVPSLFFSWVGDGHGWDQTRWLQERDATWAFVKQYL